MSSAAKTTLCIGSEFKYQQFPPQRQNRFFELVLPYLFCLSLVAVQNHFTVLISDNKPESFINTSTNFCQTDSSLLRGARIKLDGANSSSNEN